MRFQVAESRSFQFSTALHVGLALIFLVGLPQLFSKRDPQPMVLSVEILPISAVSNVRPSDKPIQKALTTKQPVKQPKPITPPPQQKAAAATPKDAVPVPDKKKAEAPKPTKKEEATSDAKDSEDFEKLLENMRKQADTAEKSDPKSNDHTTQEENKTTSDAPYDPTKPLSLSQMDMIRSQFVKCWTVPAGAKDAANLSVKVKISLSQDGTVTAAAIDASQMSRYSSDPFYRAAADSAVRAVWKCSPLQNLPADNYSAWAELILNFDPSQML